MLVIISEKSLPTLFCMTFSGALTKVEFSRTIGTASKKNSITCKSFQLLFWFCPPDCTVPVSK
ncbi:MAG: hypothetical protein EB067_05230 [Actinobacteria bacterium]|nr:hypothetical protein [Actinomycetota bacterium]